MNITDIIVLAILLLTITFAVIKIYKSKKKGKPCRSGCKNCPFSDSCKKFKK